MYYVYEFYIVDTDEIIYVGKGTRNRYKVRYNRNKLLKEMFEKYNCDSRIVKEFEDERDAFNYEYSRIKELKEKGLCRCNIHSGGAGGSGEYWTDELREEYSRNNPMKDERQRKRMSENNPMKNPDIALKTNSQKRRPIIINNIEYESVLKVCETYNVCFDVVRNWCKKGINQYGELCRYKDEEQVIFTDKRYNKGGCRPITYNGKHYETPKDMSIELDISVNKIYKWAKVGFDPYGNPCRYDDDKRNLQFEIKKNMHRPVIVNGVHYKNMSEAARENNVSATYIRDILNKKYKSKTLICEYDNQQPSQENVV